MKQTELNLLINKRRALLYKQSKLKESLNALIESINNDEQGKEWQYFSRAHIRKNNKLREKSLVWKLRIERIEQKIHNLDECIKAHEMMGETRKKEREYDEIDSKLGLIISNPKLRKHITRIARELSKNKPLENFVTDPNLRKTLEDLKIIVDNLPQKN